MKKLIEAREVAVEKLKVQEIEAERVFLKDPEGNTRGVLAWNQFDNSSGLHLMGKDGQVAAGIYLTEDGQAVLTFSEGKENVRVMLSLLENDKSSSKASPQGKNAVLYFVNESGIRRIQVALTPDGLALLTLTDEDERPRIVMAVDKDGEPSLTFYDKEGKPIAGGIDKEA